MSKLEKLIKKLCPNGVEYKELNTLVDYIQPTKYIVKSTKYNDEYDIPVLTPGQTFILGYTNEKEGIYNADKENPIILFDDFTTAFRWINFKFKVKSSAVKILIPKNNNINFRYVFYTMQTIKFDNTQHNRQWISKYSILKIPVPPIEVQNEIVRILDNFTELEVELEAELGAELEARKKQYGFYMYNIMNKSKKQYGGITLDKIYDFKYGTGNVIPKDGGKYPVYGSNGIVGTHYDFNSQDAPVIGHIGVYAGIVNWATGKHFVTYNGVICKLKNKNVLPKFAYYLLKLQKFGEKANSASQPFISYKILNETKVWIPSLNEQERIVSILDRFDKLYNDISEGLPAELESRRKQFEYYRDKLLNFKELKVENKE